MSEYLNEKVVLGLLGVLCLGSLGTLILAALDQPIPPVLAYSLVGILAALLALLNPGSPGHPGYSENGSPGAAETEDAWEWVYEDPEDDPDPGEEAPAESEDSATEAVGVVLPFSLAA